MSDASLPPATPSSAPDRVEGASFSPVMKLASSVCMLLLAYWAWRALGQGAWPQWSGPARVFMGLVMLAIAAGYWGILTSRTSIDRHSIRQSWIWHKEVRLADITRLKLIYLPGLSWLIAPRLLVRAGGLSMTTFHAADAQVLLAFKRLAYG